MAQEQGPPSGRRRFFRLAGLTASMAGRYAGHAIANRFRDEQARQQARDALHLRAGEDLAATLGELKGAVMKLGQFASQTAEFLPPAIAEPLKTLQKQAPPMPFSQVRVQLRLALEREPDEAFARIDPEPYAAASIGQVHRACLHDGREVVIKLQYPGIASSCDSDLAQLKRALKAGRLIRVSAEALDDLFEEVRARLHEELDYAQEAANMQRFRSFFADDPQLVIPAVVPELSGREVLTMALEDGDDLQALGPDYDRPLRSELSMRLFRFMCRSLFELGLIHADPNPGNFAYRPDGRLVIYDFGCIKAVPQDTVAAYRGLMRAALAHDWPAVDEALHQLGARVPGSPAIEDAFYAEWKAVLLAPLEQEQPFDFGASRVHRRVMAKSPEMLQRLHQFQPPARTLYLDRMIGGHYWTLVHLAGELDLRAELAPYLDL